MGGDADGRVDVFTMPHQSLQLQSGVMDSKCVGRKERQGLGLGRWLRKPGDPDMGSGGSFEEGGRAVQLHALGRLRSMLGHM